MHLNAQHIVCLPYHEVVPAVMSVDAFKHYRHRCPLDKRLSVEGRACHGSGLLVHYASLQPEYQAIVRKHYCQGMEPLHYLSHTDTGKAIASQQLRTQAVALQAQQALHTYAQQGIQAQELALLTQATGNDAKALTLATLASYCRLLAGIRGKHDALLLGMSSKEALYRAALANITAMPQAPNITNIDYLRQKTTAYEAQGLNALLHAHRGKPSNATKLLPEEEALLITIWADPRALADTQRYHAYKDTVTHKGLAPLSYSRINQLMNEPKRQQAVLQARFGKKYVHDHQRLVINMRPASFANALWLMDGTVKEKMYYCPIAKIHKRAYWFVIMDAHSHRIVGWSAYTGSGEPEYLVAEALSNAATHTGYLPHQLRYDNTGSAKTARMQALLARMLHYNTPCAVGNSRGKGKVEQFFGSIEGMIGAWDAHATGVNQVGTRIESQPNPDHKAMVIKQQDMPLGYDAAVADIAQDIAIWNASTGAELSVKSRRTVSPNEAYNVSIAASQDQQRPLTWELQIDLFWLWRMRGNQYLTYQYDYHGLSIVRTVLGREEVLRFVAPANGTAQEQAAWMMHHMHERFYIKYNPTDWSMIALYDMDKQLVTYATAKHLTAEALADATPADAVALAHYREVQAQQAAYSTHIVADAAQVADLEFDFKMAQYTKNKRFKGDINTAEIALKMHAYYDANHDHAAGAVEKKKKTHKKNMPQAVEYNANAHYIAHLQDTEEGGLV